MDFELPTSIKNLHHEFDKIVTLHTDSGKENLVFWNKQNQTFIVFPRQIEYLKAYCIGAFSILLSLALPGLILFLIPMSTGNESTFITLVLITATVFLSTGVYTLMAAARIGFIMLDVQQETIHLQKIGVFKKQDIAGITIRANPWTERYRSHLLSLIKNDEALLDDSDVIKNVTVGIRFYKPIFLGFRVTPLINYRHFRDAKSFQQTLADFYECQLMDL